MTESEVILREFPPNPHLVNYHTRRQLTTMMSERYTPKSENYPEKWIAALADILGLTNIHLMRHKLRLKRNPDLPWETIAHAIETVLRAYWKAIEIQSAPEDVEAHRDFKLPEKLHFEDRKVYEGVRHAQQYYLAERLYGIKGITTVVFYRDTLTIKRGYCYQWRELAPQIKKELQVYDSVRD